MTYLLNGIYKDNKVRFSSSSVVRGRAGGVLEKSYCINNQTKNSLLTLLFEAVIFQFLGQLYPRTCKGLQHMQELHYFQQTWLLRTWVS